MVETSFDFTVSDTKTIERVIEDDNLGLNHIVLAHGDSMPEHYSNSNVYMIIIRGKVTLRLDDQRDHDYANGTIVTIPFKTRMNVSNNGNEPAEFFVVKSPSPRLMPSL